MDLASANVAGPHCPRCGGKLWETSAEGRTTEFLKCAACGFDINHEVAPEPMVPQLLPDPWQPTRLETFVLALVASLKGNWPGRTSQNYSEDNNNQAVEIVRIALKLCEQIDQAQLIQDKVSAAIDNHHARTQATTNGE